MPTTEERLTTLEQQVVHFPTRGQVEALVGALGTDITTLNNSIQKLTSDINKLLSALQSVKNQLQDHETRIETLEGP